MRPILLLALALLTGCVSPAATLAPAAVPAAPAQAAAPREIFREADHPFDAPPVGDTEVKRTVDVPNGTSALLVKIQWSSASGLAATIPKGAAVKIKDPTGQSRAASSVGPGPLPPAKETRVENATGGAWIVEFEGYAPGVRATVDVSTG